VNTPRLLLVDDEELYARGLSRELSALGWHTETANSAESALLALRQSEFDAVVLDVQMPGPSGVSVLAELDRVLERPVAVLLSGYLSVETTVRAIQQGANDVLEKPVSARDLDLRLRALLDARVSGPRAANSSELRKILGETPGMRAAREQMQTAARYPELYLTILGESGTGKEQVAEAIHALGAASGRYIPVHLAAVPDHLIEVELFGIEAEAGGESRAGLFEQAGAGTLFFRELAEVPPHLHPKLLQALESRTFRRVGGDVDLPLRARIIAATRRRSFSAEYTELCERLGAFSISLPSLRERPSDIELIARNLLLSIGTRAGRPTLALSADALEVLCNHHWPGNVRELELVIKEAAALAVGPSLSGDQIRASIREHGMPSEFEMAGENVSGTFPTSSSGPVSEPLRTLERRMITDAWKTSGRNLSAAARSLGLPRTTLRDRLKKYGLR